MHQEAHLLHTVEVKKEKAAQEAARQQERGTQGQFGADRQDDDSGSEDGISGWGELVPQSNLSDGSSASGSASVCNQVAHEIRTPDDAFHREWRGIHCQRLRIGLRRCHATASCALLSTNPPPSPPPAPCIALNSCALPEHTKPDSKCEILQCAKVSLQYNTANKIFSPTTTTAAVNTRAAYAVNRPLRDPAQEPCTVGGDDKAWVGDMSVNTESSRDLVFRF